MQDRSHLAVKGDFSAQVTLPDGTLWSSGKHTDNSVRLNTKDNVQFVMKLDVSKTQGVGTGTTGWARVLDEDHLGVTIHPGGVDNGGVTDRWRDVSPGDGGSGRRRVEVSPPHPAQSALSSANGA